MTPRLTPHEGTQLRAAADRGYLVDRSRRRVCLAAHWWQRCEEQQRPYLRINATRRQARVLIDLLPTGATFSEAALEKIEAVYRRFAGPRSLLFLGKDQVSFYRLNAGAAEELVGMLQNHVHPLCNVYPLERRGGE